MKHSIALVTGATSGLGYAAGGLLADEGCREVIVTGRSLARAKEAAAQLAAKTKIQAFTPLELDLDKPSSVRSALAELVKRNRPIDFLLLNAGLVPYKQRVVTVVVLGREGWQVGVLEHGYAPSGRFCTCDNDPRGGTQQVGIEQPNSQLMMPDERGLRRLDTHHGEHALLIGNQPCIEQ